jgi:hypothetical protein
MAWCLVKQWDVDWIQVTQNRVQWRDLVSMAMYFLVQKEKKDGEFLDQLRDY